MSDTARLLADSVAAFLGRNRGVDESELFRHLQDNGFALALASDDHGGLGATWLEAATIARVWGYHAAPLPIVELLLAGRVASLAGEPLLAARLTIAPRAASSDGRVVAAVFPGAEFCATADGIVPIGAPTATSIAGEPIVGLETDPSGVRQLEPMPDQDELLRQGALLVAAQMLGAMERISEIVTDHVTVRSQFGRPLAKFQLVQTMVADAASEIDVAKAAVERALGALDDGRTDKIGWLAAKSQAGRAATVVAANAHQAMGAIGFTQEHELHTLTRRLWAWRDAWVGQSEADEAVGRLACAAGYDGLWPLVADRAQQGGVGAPAPQGTLNV